MGARRVARCQRRGNPGASRRDYRLGVQVMSALSGTSRGQVGEPLRGHPRLKDGRATTLNTSSRGSIPSGRGIRATGGGCITLRQSSARRALRMRL